MGQVYLVRYGLMHHVGRFHAEAGPYDRGQAVVVRSPRGIELGEVLTPLATAPPPGPTPAILLRAAGPDDFERARLAEQDRPRRLAACERLFRDGVWPLELIDVEPLLDGRRTVLHYLGPHHLDAAGLLEAIRTSCGLDALLAPAGIDPEAAEPGCGSCSDGGCGVGGCGSADHGDCAGCAVKDLVGRRHRAVTA